MKNELSVNIINPLKGQVTEISYDIASGKLTSYIVEDGIKLSISDDEVRDKLLQILKIAITYAKTITIDNLVDNGYSKILNCSER